MMRKLLSLLIGLTLGISAGAVLVLLFSPVSGDEFMHNLKQGYAEALASARQASAERRTELEAQLRGIRKDA